MREISVKSKDKKIKLKAKDISEILDIRSDFEIVSDISDTVNQKRVFAYDCMLNKEYLDGEIIAELLTEFLNDSISEIKLEHLIKYIEELSVEIADDIEEKYNLEDVNCSFNIYSIDPLSESFKLVYVISFDEEIANSMDSLSEIIARRQFLGKSKFYS